jgi:hypothetical protein
MQMSIDKNEIEVLEGARNRKERVKSINEDPRMNKLAQINV